MLKLRAGKGFDHYWWLFGYLSISYWFYYEYISHFFRDVSGINNINLFIFIYFSIIYANGCKNFPSAIQD